jgi:hypothetical protein
MCLLFSSPSTIATTTVLGGLRAGRCEHCLQGRSSGLGLLFVYIVCVQLPMSPIPQSLKVSFEIWNKD